MCVSAVRRMHCAEPGRRAGARGRIQRPADRPAVLVLVPVLAARACRAQSAEHCPVRVRTRTHTHTHAHRQPNKQTNTAQRCKHGRQARRAGGRSCAPSSTTTDSYLSSSRASGRLTRARARAREHHQSHRHGTHRHTPVRGTVRYVVRAYGFGHRKLGGKGPSTQFMRATNLVSGGARCVMRRAPRARAGHAGQVTGLRFGHRA